MSMINDQKKSEKLWDKEDSLLREDAMAKAEQSGEALSDDDLDQAAGGAMYPVATKHERFL